jgi:hypothetical protein
MEHVIVMGKNRNTWRILVRKLEETDYREKNRHRCENNIKMDIKEIEWAPELD